MMDVQQQPPLEGIRKSCLNPFLTQDGADLDFRRMTAVDLLQVWEYLQPKHKDYLNSLEIFKLAEECFKVFENILRANYFQRYCERQEEDDEEDDDDGEECPEGAEGSGEEFPSYSAASRQEFDLDVINLEFDRAFGFRDEIGPRAIRSKILSAIWDKFECIVVEEGVCESAMDISCWSEDDDIDRDGFTHRRLTKDNFVRHWQRFAESQFNDAVDDMLWSSSLDGY